MKSTLRVPSSPIVRPGYKQTEVGVIPEDWDCLKLGNFIFLQRGHDLTWRDRREGDVPVMGSAGQNGTHDTAIAKGPGVILGRSGASFGQAHYCEQDFWPHNTALYVTDFLGNHPLFVFYFLKSIDFSRHNSGGAQQSLNRNFISPIILAVPRPPEQRAIAEALSDVDALLDGLDRLIAKKRDLKQAAMQQLLTGQTRLPGFHGEWRKCPLGEDVTLHSGCHVLAQYCNTSGEGVPYLTGPADFQDGSINHTKYTEKPITLCGPGDILVTVKGSGAGTLVIADAIYCISRQLMAIRVRNWDSRFVYYSLGQNASQIKSAAAGLIPGLSRADILDQALPLPPHPAEQTAIAEVLSDMDAELAALEQRRAKTRALKQGMMQELLTGRTRLV